MDRGSTKATRQPGVSGDGARVSQFRLEPARRRVQVPQLLLALLLVAVSALAAVVLFSRAAARNPVLALANDVERGQVVSAEDFRVVYMGTDDPVATVDADALGSLVGLTAVADLEVGTLITPAHLVSRAGLAAGEAVVGLALSPGEYPTVRLAPGDVVDVVDVDPEAGGSVLVEAADVFDVAELGTQGSRFISLRVPAAESAAVAEAAAGGRVRLVLVSGESR